MKRFLLAAKWRAIEEYDEKITLKHIYGASVSIKITNNDAQDIIIASVIPFLAYEDKTHLIFTDKEMEKVEKHLKILFDDDVTQLIEKLNQAGITMASKISTTKKKATASTLMAQAREIKKALSSQLIEQPTAIESICDAWLTQAYKRSEQSPRAVFMFAGPSSVGKSYAAHLLADKLSEYGYAFHSFQMGNYTSDNHQFVMTGLSKGYGTARGGELTSFVKENPKSVILFEGIDHTHAIVLEALNEALDYGYVIDKFEQEKIDFSETILIFETNGGKEIYTKSEILESIKENPKNREDMIYDAISREKKEALQGRNNTNSNESQKSLLPVGFLARMRKYNVILFSTLTFEGMKTVANTAINQSLKSYSKALGIKTRIKDHDLVAQALVLGSGPDFNLRYIKDKAPMSLFDPLNDALRDGEHIISTLEIKISKALKQKIDEIVSDNGTAKVVRNLFRKTQTLHFEMVLEINGENALITLDHPQLRKIKRAKDFGDKNGLIIDIPEEGFDAIAGHHVVKERLNEVVEIFKNRKYTQKFKEHLSKGVLLYGPPGTGKTMLARAFAKEADLPFIATTGNDLRSDSKKIEQVFSLAREYAPSIVFIDEIDVFKRRNGSEIDNRVNDLLTSIDGFSDNEDERIFIIAATNLKDKIDEAILRSGRIDLHIEVDKLDKEARSYFIKKMLSDTAMFAPAIDADEIVRLTAGMSGADLDKLERESVMALFRTKQTQVSSEMLIEQINTLRYGSIRGKQSMKEELIRTAYHEAGHAVAIRVLEPETIIDQATIVPRGDSNGFVAREYNENGYAYTKQMAMEQLCISLAGREVERKKFGAEEIGAGAYSDLNKATNIAYEAIAKYGMDDELLNCDAHGLTRLNVVANGDGGMVSVPYLSEKISVLVEKWLTKATEEVRALLEEHWDKVESIAQELLARETLKHTDIQKIL